jgi:DNA-binding Lrp family transcriptional regulator
MDFEEETVSIDSEERLLERFKKLCEEDSIKPKDCSIRFKNLTESTESLRISAINLNEQLEQISEKYNQMSAELKADFKIIKTNHIEIQLATQEFCNSQIPVFMSLDILKKYDDGMVRCVEKVISHMDYASLQKICSLINTLILRLNTYKQKLDSKGNEFKTIALCVGAAIGIAVGITVAIAMPLLLPLELGIIAATTTGASLLFGSGAALYNAYSSSKFSDLLKSMGENASQLASFANSIKVKYDDINDRYLVISHIHNGKSLEEMKPEEFLKLYETICLHEKDIINTLKELREISRPTV